MPSSLKFCSKAVPTYQLTLKWSMEGIPKAVIARRATVSRNTENASKVESSAPAFASEKAVKIENQKVKYLTITCLSKRIDR